MAEIFQKLKLPFIIIALLFGGFIVYNTFIKAPTSTALLKTDTGVGVSLPDSNFLPLLLKIQGVTLDEKLFLNPVFRGLSDFSQPIVPESQGKPNPFVGISGAVVNSKLESLGFKEEKSTTTQSIILPKKTTK